MASEETMAEVDFSEGERAGSRLAAALRSPPLVMPPEWQAPPATTPPIPKGTRVRFSAHGQLSLLPRGKYAVREGTVVGIARHGCCVYVHWDGTKPACRTSYHRDFLMPLPPEPNWEI